MRPGVALCMALVALSTLRRGERGILEKVSAGVAAGLSLWLVGYEFGLTGWLLHRLTSGADQYWLRPQIQPTVAGFTALLGAAVLLIDVPHLGRTLGGVFAGSALYFSLISVTGHLTANGELIRHGGVLARGSFSGNLCIVLLALAILWQVRMLCPWCRGLLSWAPATLGFVGLLITITYWGQTVRQGHAQSENGARVVAAEIRSRLQADGEQMTRSFVRLADQWPSHHIASAEEWQRDILGYFRDFKGLSALALVDSSGAFLREGAVSDKVLDPGGPGARLLAQTAVETLRTASPMTTSLVAEGREGPEIVVAVATAHSREPRALALLLELKPLAEQILRSHEGNLYFVSIRVDGQQIRQRGRLTDADSHIRVLDRARALGLTWNIEVMPETALVNPSETGIAGGDVVLLAGFLVTGLLVAAANLWLLARERSILVEQVNDELRNENLRRAETEHALLIAKNTADEANRSKSQFLAAMSHEIRTPMNAILGMAELLAESPLNDAQREYVRVFRSAGGSLMRLLNDILDFSKMEAGKFHLVPVDFHLPAMVDSTIKLMDSPVREKHLEFVCERDPNLPTWVHGDPERIQQIMVNLLSNATKFTTQGSVTLRVRLVEHPEPSTARISFEVADTGIGIEPDKLSLIFESFEQADSSISRRFGGTGLGLAISRNLVNQMSGRLEVESTPGKGSSFRALVTLPVVEPPAEKPHRQRRQLQALADATSSTPRLQILIVDDVIENQLVVAGFLDGRSHSLDFAINGLEAVERAQGREYDLIFMDVQMPVLDGLAATRAIREFEATAGRKPSRIVALSADGLPEHRQASFSAGCSDYLLKPVSKKVLLRAVAQCIKEPTSPASAHESEEAIVS